MISDELLKILNQLQTASAQLKTQLPDLLVELHKVIDEELPNLIADHPDVFSELLEYQEDHLQQLEKHAALLNMIHRHNYNLQSDLFDDTETSTFTTTTSSELTPRTVLEPTTTEYLIEVFRMAINDIFGLSGLFAKGQPERQEISKLVAEIGKWQTSLKTGEDYLDIDELSRSIEPLRESSGISQVPTVLDRMMQRVQAANSDEQLLRLKNKLTNKIVSSDFHQFTRNNHAEVVKFHNRVIDAATIDDIGHASKSFSKATRMNAFKQKVETLKIWKAKPETSTQKHRNLAQEVQKIIDNTIASQKTFKR